MTHLDVALQVDLRAYVLQKRQIPAQKVEPSAYREQRILVPVQTTPIESNLAAILTDSDSLRALAVRVDDVDVVDGHIIAVHAQGATRIVRARCASVEAVRDGDLVALVVRRVLSLAVDLGSASVDESN